MDAIILAAGEGKRFFSSVREKRALPPEIDYPIPKCLYPVSIPGAMNNERKPVLGHLLDSAFQGGIETCYIATGYQEEKIARYIETDARASDIHLVRSNPLIDYTKGPLYTLAGVMQYFLDHGVLQQENFDKIILIIPSDLIIARRAIYYITGNPARGMMASRAMVHAIMENRPTRVKRDASKLGRLLPDKFKHLASEDILQNPLIPAMAVHVDILIDIMSYMQEGLQTFIDAMRAWIERNLHDDRSFKTNVNIIPASAFGESFYWFDVDGESDLVDNGL